MEGVYYKPRYRTFSMKFIEDKKPAEGYIHSYTSECGRVVFGIHAVIFGLRVASGFKKYPIYDIDYCCNRNTAYLQLIYNFVGNILTHTEYSLQIYDKFPPQYQKPFFKDTINFGRFIDLTIKTVSPIELIEFPIPKNVWELQQNQVQAAFNHKNKPQ